MSEVIRDSLERLTAGQSLSEEQAFSLMDAIMGGEATPAQIGGVLLALRVRGETVDEIVGFARAMRHHATAPSIRRRPVIDTCGTGGDRSFTFNVSTVSAFVVAGAGLPVAKHGNRSATSKSGSADMLEAMGIPIQYAVEDVARLIDTVGFGFLFAQQVHPSMRYAAPVRRELGVRTVFNVLGPLTNPLNPEFQLMGVFAPDWVEPVAQALARLGIDRAAVVHGHGGLDEVSLSGPTRVALVDQGHVTVMEITPEELGLPRYPLGAFQGGDPATNARICRDILTGEAADAMTDLVLANAGMALYVGRRASSPAEGVELARDSIRQGRALEVLTQLIPQEESSDVS